MGRNRNKENEGLPVGVYQRPSGRYQYRHWTTDENGTRQTALGVCDDPFEAGYKRLVAIQGHHWEGVEHNPEEYWGFIYCITHRASGKMYIGKKQYRLWDGPPGGYKCTDPEDEWFDESLWRQNDWQFYTGSCEELNRDLKAGSVWDYEYKVLHLSKNKLDLHLAEVFEQMGRDVLEALDANGEYLYYNRNIAGMEFRAPFLKADMRAKQEATQKEVKMYYLRPRLCRNCQSVIPYPGNGGCVECGS